MDIILISIMIKMHYNATKYAHKDFTVVKMPLKHEILKKSQKNTKKNHIFKKSQKKPAISGQIWGGLNRFILAGFFWLAFLGPTLSKSEPRSDQCYILDPVPFQNPDPQLYLAASPRRAPSCPLDPRCPRGCAAPRPRDGSPCPTRAR